MYRNRVGCKGKRKVDYLVRHIFREYTKQDKSLNDTQFRAVIKEINTILKNRIAEGRDVELPLGFGALGLRKKKVRDSIVDGKLKTNRIVDWKQTQDMWDEDPDAYEKKLKIRYVEQEYNYIVRWIKNKANFRYCRIYYFYPARGLKKLGWENLNNGKLLDALPDKKDENWNNKYKRSYRESQEA